VVSELLAYVRVYTVASKHATRGVPIVVVVLMCASPVLSRTGAAAAF
jgi:hypothetical protein